MDQLEQNFDFGVQQAVEQKPFEDGPARALFKRWCDVNDSIRPVFMYRDAWEDQARSGILRKRSDGMNMLYVPRDLRLWEMVGIMEAVDSDTYFANPKKRIEAKTELSFLGRTFQNAGTYIANRLDGISEGREIAEALAVEFYDYGSALVSGKKPEKSSSIDDVASRDISQEDTELVDEFLAGSELYQSRRKIAETRMVDEQLGKEEGYEIERQRTLSQFFRVAEKALFLEARSSWSEPKNRQTARKVWRSDTPIHSAFLRKVSEAAEKHIETPRRKLEMSIFYRGLEKMSEEIKERGWRQAVNNFFKKVGIDVQLERRRLIDALGIPAIRAELEELRRRGDIVLISKKEREITDRIQKVVSKFPYDVKANNPAEIVANNYINCVGASILGGILLKEAGVDYLVSNMPKHSVIFIATSDDNVEWRDMTYPLDNEKLTDEMVVGKNKDGSPLKVSDIAAYARKPTPEGLAFGYRGSRFKRGKRLVTKEPCFVGIFGPERGQQIQLLFNTGIALYNSGRYQEAAEAYLRTTKANQCFSAPYRSLGKCFGKLGRYQEAAEAYLEAIKIDPSEPHPYYELGSAFAEFGHAEKAISAYQEFIDRADQREDAELIAEATEAINSLKK